MREWHVPPEQINRNWTPRLLHRMLEARNKHMQRVNQAMEEARGEASEGSPREKPVQPKHYVSNEEFFRRHGITVNRAEARKEN